MIDIKKLSYEELKALPDGRLLDGLEAAKGKDISEARVKELRSIVDQRIGKLSHSEGMNRINFLDNGAQTGEQNREIQIAYSENLGTEIRLLNAALIDIEKHLTEKKRL